MWRKTVYFGRLHCKQKQNALLEFYNFIIFYSPVALVTIRFKQHHCHLGVDSLREQRNGSGWRMSRNAGTGKVHGMHYASSLTAGGSTVDRQTSTERPSRSVRIQASPRRQETDTESTRKTVRYDGAGRRNSKCAVQSFTYSQQVPGSRCSFFYSFVIPCRLMVGETPRGWAVPYVYRVCIVYCVTTLQGPMHVHVLNEQTHKDDSIMLTSSAGDAHPWWH